MTFDITKVKITSKLMLLQGGCTNFRSIGEEITINYAENSNTLVIADMNGAGKSTLFEHLPLYALTGKTSSKEDKVDALVNTTVGKAMVSWLVWYFAGTYYKVIRGRKPNRFDIYSLVEGEWVEISNLPVSNRDRQHFMYSLLGLDYKTASNVLENTVLLSGQRFKGFSSLSTPERRDLIEPILDLSIFSALNAEAKALRGEIIVEQKQTYLEITDAKLQVALVEQGVDHKKQTMHNTIDSYTQRKEELEVSLGKITKEYKEALEMDTSGGDLHVQFEGESEDLARELHELEIELKKDLESLGEFVVDEFDVVITKLRADLYTIDQTIQFVKEDLNEKRKGLDGAVVKTLSGIKEEIEQCTVEYGDDIKSETVDHELKLQQAVQNKDNSKASYDKALEDFNLSVEHQSDCSINVEGLTKEFDAVLDKEAQYKAKCDKLSEAIVFLEAKKSQEESNLSGLVHAGTCPSCQQATSAEYLSGLKEGLNKNISAIQEDIDLYISRFNKGEDAITALGITTLREGLRVATMQLDMAKPDEVLVINIKQGYEQSLKALSDLEDTVVGEKLTQQYEMNKLQLQNELDKAEAKIKDSLGELETKYNILVNSKPSQVENIEQQIEDRKSSLKGEFGGKERHLHNVYNLAVANVQERLKTADRRLKERLEDLVKGKSSVVSNCELTVKDIENSLVKLEKQHNTSLDNLQEDYDATLNKQFCKVSDLVELNKQHDKQQQDIEDYNDMLLLLSDKEGKADIIKNIIPKLNKDVNTYLEAMGLFINLEIDSEFNMVMNSDDRKGQSLFSLSAGQKSKLDLAILLSLRELASSKESVSTNLLVLDEILEPFSAEALQDIILMLQERFKDNNTVLITQRGEEVKDLFQVVKNYALRGGFTVEIENE